MPGQARLWRPLRNFFRNLSRRLRAAPPAPGSTAGAVPAPKAAPGPPRVEFSYTIYWTKQARLWRPDRRREVYAGLQAVLRQPGFEANDYQRRYTLPGLDEQAHAGASLLALNKVLLALLEHE